VTPQVSSILKFSTLVKEWARPMPNHFVESTVFTGSLTSGADPFPSCSRNLVAYIVIGPSDSLSWAAKPVARQQGLSIVDRDKFRCQ
jgi:hypothetical protein